MEGLRCNVPDLHLAETPGQREREDPEWGVQQPSGTTPEHTPGGGQDGLDAHGLVPSEGSRGECRCSGCTIAHVDRYQVRRDAGLIGPLRVLHLRSTLRRGQLKLLAPSRPSWNPSPLSTRNIRFVLVLCSRLSSGNPLYSKLLLLRTRSIYFSHAYLSWRSCLSSLQMMMGRQSVVKGCQSKWSTSVQAGC